MPDRPRSHILEARSRYKLHSTFAEQGWVSWDLSPDYGEDIFVRIFIDGKSTPYSFFVQIKAIDNIENHRSKDRKYLKYVIKTGHLNLWNDFWEPVILMLYDAKTEAIYWGIIQDYLQNKDINEIKKSKTIYIPSGSILDRKGLDLIARKTKSRFERFELEQTAAKQLIETINRVSNVQVISYSPQDENFIIQANERLIWVMSGEEAKTINNIAKDRNMTSQEVIDEIFLDGLEKMEINIEEYERRDIIHEVANYLGISPLKMIHSYIKEEEERNDSDRFGPITRDIAAYLNVSPEEIKDKFAPHHASKKLERDVPD